ncbi:MAG: Ig-like domain-containing protein, partial [Lachnospiraceae bacterium]|nr:Ig-like domain-containing protein [Lachnospiraceae bacterium]
GSMNGSKVAASNFTWSSSNSTIASVNSSGLVTAIAVGANGAKGTATITAVDKNDSENVATCKITTVSPLTSIQLSLSQNAVERFQAFDLQVNYLPEDTTDNRTVTWSTKNSGIAWVQNKTNGIGIYDKCSVSTNTLGTTSIVANVGGKTATCEVTVRAVIKNIEFKDESITIYDGQSQKLQVNYEPVYTSDEVLFEWDSKNKDVAKVENGVVTGVGEGSAVITAKFVNGLGETKQANCTVSVNKCKVQFYDVSGNLLIAVDKEYGSTYDSLHNMTPPDQTEFAGWYTKKDGQGTKVGEEDLVVGTVSLYPYFLELDKGFTVKPIGNQMYTGTAIAPVVNVYDKNTLLKLNQDYTIAYKNNKNVNNEGSTSYPYVIVKGKGNYAGSQTVSFNIIQKNIDSADIKVADILVAYNGKIIKSVPVVMQGNTKLKQNTHYKVSYPSLSQEYAYRQPGVYPVLLEGIGNYTGSRLIYEVITKKVLASKLTVVKIPNQTYTGNDIEPELTVKYGKKLLEEGVHYTVDYGNDNIGIGKKTLTVNGISSAGYLGSKSIPYNIVGRDIRKVKVSGIEVKEFTNDYPEEGIVQDNYSLIYADLDELTEGVDYEVSYLKNKQAGISTIIFRGINQYSGILKKTFKITKLPLNDSMDVKMDNGSQPFEMTYLKDASKPELIISSNGIALTKNVDYTLSYQNYSAVNDGSNPLKQPTIIIKGKGNYSGTLSCNYKITQADFNNAVVTALDATYSPKAGKWKSSPVVTDTNGKKLKVGSDYEKTISYNYVENTVLEDEVKTVRLAGSTVETTDIPPAGTKIQVRVTGRGNYSSDSITCVYRITQTSITKASVNVKSQIYNKDKAASTEGITVSQNDIVMKVNKVQLQNEDYVILPNSFTKNKIKGTASFIIQGIGNYGGTKKVTFKITSFPIIWWWGA